MVSRQINQPCHSCPVFERSVFSALSHEERELLEGHKKCHLYRKGQVIFYEGTPSTGVYCIGKGKVKVYKMGKDGKDQIILLAKEGDLLGFRALLSHDPYPVSAETLDDASICFIPKLEFLNALKNSPKLSALLLEEACKELATMTQYITNLAQQSVRERLAGTLLDLKDFYKEESDGNGFIIDLRREDLANIIGTATETLIRLLHDLKEEGVIDIQKRKIVVLSEPKLKRIAGM